MKVLMRAYEDVPCVLVTESGHKHDTRSVNCDFESNIRSIPANTTRIIGPTTETQRAVSPKAREDKAVISSPVVTMNAPKTAARTPARVARAQKTAHAAHTQDARAVSDACKK
jgi:hypothetical protein